eukprot:00529.XXX_861_1243_1 [CDS] Oithona nana genome sequencing.
MEENSELKAGHAPAQKVGGMRIVQHKHKEEKHEGSPPKMSDEDKEEFGEDRPVKSTASMVVSGAKTSEDSAFPPDAVKAFHEKPMPTHDKGASQKPKVIQQPRK